LGGGQLVSKYDRALTLHSSSLSCWLLDSIKIYFISASIASVRTLLSIYQHLKTAGLNTKNHSQWLQAKMKRVDLAYNSFSRLRNGLNSSQFVIILAVLIQLQAGGNNTQGIHGTRLTKAVKRASKFSTTLLCRAT